MDLYLLWECLSSLPSFTSDFSFLPHQAAVKVPGTGILPLTIKTWTELPLVSVPSPGQFGYLESEPEDIIFVALLVFVT